MSFGIEGTGEVSWEDKLERDLDLSRTHFGCIGLVNRDHLFEESLF